MTPSDAPAPRACTLDANLVCDVAVGTSRMRSGSDVCRYSLDDPVHVHKCQATMFIQTPCGETSAGNGTCAVPVIAFLDFRSNDFSSVRRLPSSDVFTQMSTASRTRDFRSLIDASTCRNSEEEESSRS